MRRKASCALRGTSSQLMKRTGGGKGRRRVTAPSSRVTIRHAGAYAKYEGYETAVIHGFGFLKEKRGKPARTEGADRSGREGDGGCSWEGEG